MPYMALVAFSDYTQPKDTMPGSISANMIILQYGIYRYRWTIYVLIGPFMLWHKWSGQTNYVVYKWSPWTTYAWTIYAVTSQYYARAKKLRIILVDSDGTITLAKINENFKHPIVDVVEV